jgi:5-methylcytosine-specific restriction endonuclease McrA
MNATKEQLDKIYRRTCGYCHICHKKLARTNYARLGTKGAWEIEHSIPRSKGGTDHMNNLFPAHISCNRDKGNVTSRTARARNGKTRCPLSPKSRNEAKTENGLLGAACGGLAGLAVGGPVGAVIGALAGGSLAASQNPDK